MSQTQEKKQTPKTRFAVVGLGHIAQVAVLPAFAQARNCKLTALVSGDSEKLRVLGGRYAVPTTTDYAGYDELLDSGTVDAVYICLPNHLHAEFTVRAAQRGVHVLCEKPMAPTEADCELMIRAARRNDVRLMVAYRLHFESVNLEVSEMVHNGVIGEPRMFSSVFGQNIKSGNVRLVPWEQGGGSVFDMGVYCINAARYIFREEPLEAVAAAQFGRDERFRVSDESTNAVLTFPGGRVAQVGSSFGTIRSDDYHVLGTKGEIVVRHPYDNSQEVSYQVRARWGGVRSRTVEKRDQFAPQLIYFSRCVLQRIEPEPDGWEGYADVRVVRAIHEAARTGRRVNIEPLRRHRRPARRQAMWKPAIEEPTTVHVQSPIR